MCFKSVNPNDLYNRGVYTSDDCTCMWYNASSSYCQWMDVEFVNAASSTYLEQIKYHINSGLPVIIKLKNSMHWVVAYGYDSSKSTTTTTADIKISYSWTTNNKTLADALKSHLYNVLKFVYFKK